MTAFPQESDVQLQTVREGVLLPIHVQPKARREALTGVIDGRLKIAVRQPPERGKANQAVIALLAKSLAVRKNALCLVSGHSSSRKMVRVDGLSAAELRQRLQQILGGGT